MKTFIILSLLANSLFAKNVKFSIAYMADIGYSKESADTHSLEKNAVILNFEKEDDLRKACFIGIIDPQKQQDIALSVFYFERHRDSYTLSYPKTLYGPLLQPGQAEYTLSTKGSYNSTGPGVAQLDYRHETLYFGETDKVRKHVLRGGYTPYKPHKVEIVLEEKASAIGNVIEKEVSFEKFGKKLKVEIFCTPT